jgi:hypothetical protein
MATDKEVQSPHSIEDELRRKLDTQKKALISGGILVVLIGLLMTPPHIKDKLVAIPMYFTLERQCFREYEDRLKDPWSAYVTGSELLKRSTDRNNPDYYEPILSKYEKAIQVSVQAKNGFGAYDEQSFDCPLNSRGTAILKDETLMWRISH